MSPFEKPPFLNNKQTRTGATEYSRIPRSDVFFSRKKNTPTDFGLGLSHRQFAPLESQTQRQRWIRFIGGAGILALLGGLLIGSYAVLTFGQTVAKVWSLPLFILAGFSFAVWLALVLTMPHNHLIVYQKGIVLGQARGKLKPLRWSEIAGISFYQEEWAVFYWTKRSTKCILFPHQGKPINLAKYCAAKELPELATRIKAALYPEIEPLLRKHLWNQRPIYFGKLILSPAHLGFRKEQFLWDEVNTIDIDNGFLRVHHKNRGLIRIPLLEVPNIELFLMLSQLARTIGLRARKSGKQDL